MISDNFAYWGYSVGWSTIRKLPEKRAYRLFSRLADQAWRRNGPSVRQYEKNLRRVLPAASPAEIRDVSRAGFQSYAHYWCDAFRMPDWPRERILSLQITGLEHIDTAVASGRGLVFVGPHGGNYDHGAAFVAQRYGSLTTVAERLKPYRLFEKFVAFREELGMEVLGFGAPDLVNTLVSRVEDNTIVGLVGDRDLSRHGVPVTFFGEATRMPAGAALVARRTGATLLAVNFYYRDGQPAATVFEPIPVATGGTEDEDVRTITQSIAGRFEIGIGEHPSDWHMLQPLWLSDLDQSRLQPTQTPT